MIDALKVVLRLAIAAVLLWLLARLAGLSWASLSDISWHFVALALLFSIITILLRTIHFRLIARNKSRADFASWTRMTATYELQLSALSPNWGDHSFPDLAQRQIGLDLGTGARVIALSRTRDALTLMTLAGLGLVLESRLHAAFAVIPVTALLISLKLEPTISLLLKRLPTDRKLNLKLAPMVRDAADLPPLRYRYGRVFSNFVVWLSASAAIWAAFMSAGAGLPIGDVFTMIAGLKLIAMLAISVAGLGVCEIGAAGIMIWMGWSFESAAISAVIGRPALLISALVAAGLVWCVSMLARIHSARATTAQLNASRPEI